MFSVVVPREWKDSGQACLPHVCAVLLVLTRLCGTHFLPPYIYFKYCWVSAPPGRGLLSPTFACYVVGLGSPSGKDWRGPAFMNLTVWCEASHRLLFPTMLDSFSVGDRPVLNNVLIWGLLTWSGYNGKWNAFVWAFQHDVASLSLFLTVFFIVNSCSLSLHAKLLCKPLSVRVVQCRPRRDQTEWVSGHLMSGGWAVI